MCRVHRSIFDLTLHNRLVEVQRRKLRAIVFLNHILRCSIIFRVLIISLVRSTGAWLTSVRFTLGDTKAPVQLSFHSCGQQTSFDGTFVAYYARTNEPGRCCWKISECHYLSMCLSIKTSAAFSVELMNQCSHSLIHSFIHEYIILPIGNSTLSSIDDS